MLQVNERMVAVDDEGYLLDPEDWNRDVALALAQSVEIDLDDQHWEVVHFVRDFYEKNQTVPEARHALKYLAQKFGKDVVNRKFLYRLFPYGYGQQACKIAGMRKPLKLMLDV